jgi:hypothetical protein
MQGAATIQEVEEALPETKVVSMLNGKYIIIDGNISPVINKYAYGNCWFVDSFVPAATPDDEIALLAATDLHTTAVIGNDFAWAQDAIRNLTRNSADSCHFEQNPNCHFEQNPNCHFELDEKSPKIQLTHYAPNELRYSFSTDTERAAIFSEIYYPKGWKAWIEPAGTYGEVRNGHYQPSSEGRPIELFRADWMLRGAMIPSGEGQLIMRFEPDSYQVGEDISRASSITLILLLIASAAGMIFFRRQNGDA